MKIVVVDSCRVELDLLSTMLVENGHETVLFTDALEALKFIQCDQSVNVLLTGLETTSMTGSELCWEVRLLAQRGRQIYIIAMSTNNEEGNLIETLDCGADDFIHKPPKQQELMARLRVIERMRMMQEELIKLASLDCMTGIFNRRAFFEAAVAHCHNAVNGEKLTAVMFDIDHFKKVNDRYGHDVGDRAIVSVVDCIDKETGLFARMGGEEFALLLPGYDKAAAMKIANKIRVSISRLLIETETSSLKLTCSFGVSEWSKTDSIESLLKRADLALYRAKESGRNRVEFGKYNPNDFVPDLSEQVEIIELNPELVELIA